MFRRKKRGIGEVSPEVSRFTVAGNQQAEKKAK